MALSPEIIAIIDKKIADLTSTAYRRPAMSINNFVVAYGSFVSQTEHDIDDLAACGLDRTKLPYYKGLQETLILTVGERRGTTALSQEKKAVFDQNMTLAEIDRKRLLIVANYITSIVNDKNAQRNLAEIQKGSGIIDTLCDNIALVAFVSKNMRLAAQIRPGKFEITSAYLDEVNKRAMDLLSLKGYSFEKEFAQNTLVDRQKRVCTLCLDAVAEIRQFAYAAYFDNVDYYNEFYAGPFRKEDTATEPSAEDAAVKVTTESSVQ